MKRFLVSIIAVLYFTISSGVVMNIHYCMGRLSSVKLENFSEKSCACSKQKHKSCCKTEFKVVKLEDNHQAAYADFFFHAPVGILSSPFPVGHASLLCVKPAGIADLHAPPDLSRQDTYLRNCVFRI